MDKGRACTSIEEKTSYTKSYIVNYKNDCPEIIYTGRHGHSLCHTLLTCDTKSPFLGQDNAQIAHRKWY